MEGTVVGGLVAEEERELAFLIAEGQIVCHSDVLETLGALAEPVVLRHILDQDGFGGGGGLVLGAEGVEELVEFMLIFGRQDVKGAGEAMAQIVFAGCGFSGVSGGTGGELGVLAIGGNLGSGGHRVLLGEMPGSMRLFGA